MAQRNLSLLLLWTRRVKLGTLVRRTRITTFHRQPRSLYIEPISLNFREIPWHAGVPRLAKFFSDWQSLALRLDQAECPARPVNSETT